MSEREYQQRMLKSESKIVFCNWDRAKGKTYAIARHIEDKIPTGDKIDILIVVPFSSMKKCIIKEIENQIGYFGIIEEESNGIYKVFSKLKNKEKGELNANINIISASNPNALIGDRKRYKYVYIDNLYLMNNTNCFSMLDGIEYKQLFIMTTDSNIEYIEDDSRQLNENDWIEQEIKKLMKEFSEIPNDGNTTKRRESVLGMIRELKNINGKDVEQTLLNKAIRENNVDDICNIEINTGVAMGLSIAIYNGNLTYEQALELLDSYCPDNKMVRAIFIDKHNRSIR